MGLFSIFSSEPAKQKRTSEVLYRDDVEGEASDSIARQMELMKQGRKITGVLENYNAPSGGSRKQRGRR